MGKVDTKTWNKPKDKLPERDLKYKNLSVETEVVTNEGEKITAFCFLPEGTWYRTDNHLQIFEGVRKWRYIK